MTGPGGRNQLRTQRRHPAPFSRWWPGLAGLVLLVGTLGRGAPATAQTVTGTARESAPPQAIAPDFNADPALAFEPDTVIRPPSGVEIILQRTPGSPTVALHLAVEVQESRLEAGAGAVLVEMGVRRAAALAQRAGALLTGERTEAAVTYTVAGAIEELDYLAWVLREAARSPTRDEVTFEPARARVRARVSRARETPQGALALELREAILPGVPDVNGTTATLDAMSGGSVVEFWNRSHQANRMTLVVIGDVEPVTLLALSRDLGAPAEQAAPPLVAPFPTGSPPPRPEVLRYWFAQAHPLPTPRDPRNAVLAFLANEVLSAEAPGMELAVQLWELGDVAALVVMGGAYGRERRQMQRSVEGVLEQVRARLSQGSLEHARAQSLDQVLQKGGTPWGRAGAMADHWLARGDASAAGVFVARLETLTLGEMTGYLERVAAQAPLTAELVP